MQKDQKHLCAENYSNKLLKQNKGYCGSFETSHEAGLIKESSSHFRSVPKRGVYQDPLPKPKTKRSVLSGRVGIGAEKIQDRVTLDIKDTPKN